MLKADPEGLTDQELIARIQAGRDDVGCYVWLVAPVIAAVVCGLLWGGPAAIGALIASYFLCQGFWRWRKRLPRIRAGELARAELQRRYRIAGVSSYEAEAVAELARDGGPEAVLLFSSRGLPHGGHSFIRIELALEARAQIWLAPLPFDLEHGADPVARLYHRELQLTAAAATRWRELIAALTPAALVPPGHFVRDGLPCEAVVLRRNAPTLRAKLNMAGLPQVLRAHPCAHLLQSFLELELTAQDRPPRVIGSASPWGDISISNR